MKSRRRGEGEVGPAFQLDPRPEVTAVPPVLLVPLEAVKVKVETAGSS